MDRCCAIHVSCVWDSPYFFSKFCKECTSETCDFLVWTHQYFIIQGSLDHAVLMDM